MGSAIATANRESITEKSETFVNLNMMVTKPGATGEGDQR